MCVPFQASSSFLLFFVYSAFRRGTPGELVECKSWIKLEKTCKTGATHHMLTSAIDYD